MKKIISISAASLAILTACSSEPSVDTSNFEQLDEQTILQSLPEEQLKVSELVQNKDINGCEQVEAAHLREQCLTNIYLEEAMSQKDPAFCEKINLQEVQDLCKQQLEN